MTAALALSPAAEAALARTRVNIQAIAQIVDVEPFTSAEQVTRAASLLSVVETYGASLEAARTAEKEPSLRASQAIDRAFRPDKKELERVSGILRGAIARYRTAQETARAAALEAASAAARAGDSLAANQAILSIERPPDLGATAERWTYEIDPTVPVDLRTVPLEMLCLDMPRVRAEIAAANREGRPPEVAGITFRKALTLAVGRL